MQHIYIHVPFCSGKCAYCALPSFAGIDRLAPDYVRALDAELAAAIGQWGRLRPETVYVGGGTPTHLEPSLLSAVLTSVRTRLDTSELREWSIEAAPGSVSVETMDILKRHGVTRMSFGVQSFSDAVLMRMGRRHSGRDVLTSLDIARQGGMDNVGIDLIAGLAGSDARRWRRDLDTALSLDLAHLSIYGLMMEAGTRLTREAGAGTFKAPSDERISALLDMAEDALTAAGFEHYEISNYCRPGRECLHNLGYWDGRDYLGFGPGAASRVNLERWTNAPAVRAYCAAILRGDPPPREHDTLSERDSFAERIMFRLRTNRGLRLGAVESPASACSGAEQTRQWERELRQLAAHGMLDEQDGTWKLTRRGRHFADTVASVFVT